MMPRLAIFLKDILPDSSNDNRRVICLIISMMLKFRHSKMCLVQKVISVYLFGNSVHKKVYNCLQPLMVCLTYSATLSTIDRTIEGYDHLPITWRDSLLQYVPQPQDSDCDDFGNASGSTMVNRLGWVTDQHYTSDADSECSVDSLTDIDQAELNDFLSFLSVSDVSENESTSDTESDYSDANSIVAPPFSPICDTERKRSLDLDKVESDQEESHDQILLPCHEDLPLPSIIWNGFKLVIDNVDKNYRQCFHQIDKKTTSIHYVHYYAVCDRINLSSCSEAQPTAPINVQKLIINLDDLKLVTDDTIVLIARMLSQHMDCFKSQSKDVPLHIKSEYAIEMSKRSKVVPLGVIKKCENKVDEMCSILEELHRYVPTDKVTLNLTLPNGESRPLDSESFHRILLGGDQLTAARARSGCSARADHDSSGKRLSGVLPVTEDWHAKMCYLKVLWNILFKPNLTCQKGTLPQLKNLIHCTANLDPTKNMKGCEDFLTTVLCAHVICAAKKILSEGCDCYNNVFTLAKEIIVRFVSFDPDIKETSQDKVYQYALQVLNLGLLWHAFNDSIKEGDGNRILTYYKFFLLAYKAGKCHNYCKEVINLLLQYNFLFTERQAQQLKWCRVVNTSGKPGKNISCDLHIEHLNRHLKSMIQSIHTKNPEKAIDRIAKSIGTVDHVCRIFEQENKAQTISGKHTRPNFAKELELMITELEDKQVFTDLNRKPSSLHYIQSVLQLCTKDKLKTWIPKKIRKYQL